ncbi:MAG: tetratricopeptide repeat protein, partial [Gammaproteobacteria bacterium]|nr:tetratricopeptide repeat protein [Gammaproteobacteria bacterium]
VTLGGADVLVPALALPEWVLRLVALLLILGFPLSLVMAWHFDWTPDGIIRADSVDDAAPVAQPADPKTEVADKPPADTPTAPAKASVAVLPFVNISGDKENEYFSDGLSEELLNVLSKVSALKVAARTSSFHFKGQTGDIAEIARKLGVASILEGSVRQSGVQVRITAQLINAADGYHLWSETFDRELDDIFAVQDEIASSVADALKVKLLGQVSGCPNACGTENAEAFQAHLKGVHHRNRGSDEAAQRNAIECFQKAIELDPGYAQAHAGLAMAWEEMATNDFVGLEEGVSKATAAAAKAIELAPDLADGHLIMARLLLAYKMDMAGGQKAIETALELNPGNAEVQIESSRMNALFGRSEQSIAAAKKALELDPVSMYASVYLGRALYEARHYDEAIAIFRHVLEMDPHHARPHYGIGMCQFLQGDLESALEEVEQEPLAWMRHSGMAILLHHLGRTEEAERALSLLIENYGDNGVYQRAQVYAQRGDTDQAIQDLNRSREIGDPGISQLLVDPLIDPLRDDPRFIELMEKTGFAAL